VETPSPTSAAPSHPVNEHKRARTFWERRVRDPIVLQLTQGITPEKIALTLAVGFALGMFPVFGCTTLLCFCAAYVLRLNQPIIQLLNQALLPVHLPVFFALWQLGERVFHVKSDERLILTPPVIYRAFRHDLLKALHDYGEGIVHSIFVWAVLVLPAIAVIYYLSLPVIRGITRLKSEVAAKAAGAHPPPVP
jgi:uncharacterized protein (DUF2062 family)